MGSSASFDRLARLFCTLKIRQKRHDIPPLVSPVCISDTRHGRQMEEPRCAVAWCSSDAPASEARSTTTGNTLTPRARISVARASRALLFLAAMATLKPRAAASRARERPILDDAPVTTAQASMKYQETFDGSTTFESFACDLIHHHRQGGKSQSHDYSAGALYS